jgi:hypothetical protein
MLIPNSGHNPPGMRPDPADDNLDDLGDAADLVDYALRWIAEGDPNIEIRGSAECEPDSRDDAQAWLTLPMIRVRLARNKAYPDIAARMALGDVSVLFNVAHSCFDAAEERLQRMAEQAFAAWERSINKQG